MNVEETRNVTLRLELQRNMILNLTEIDLPRTYKEAVTNPNQYSWKKTIKSDLRSHKDNNTWTN